MKQTSVVFTLFSVLTLTLSSSAAAQVRIDVDDREQCPTCAIRLDLQVTLGSVSEPTVGTTSHALWDSSDRIFLGHDQAPSQIMQFDSTGAFVRALGREGDGPGEHRRLMRIALGPGDSLYAFDYGVPRVTVYTPDLEVGRVDGLPGPVRDAVVFTDGRMVLHARIPTSERIGLPLHLASSDGSVLHSFGASNPVERPVRPALQLRYLAWASSDAVWAARMNEYVVEEWRRDGTLVRRFERDPDWFDGWLERRGVSASEPPQPFLRGVHQDDRGRLLVLATIAGENWQEGLEIEGDQRGERSVRVRNFELLYDSRLDVIDTETGRLIVSQKLPQYLVGFTNRGDLVGYRTGAADIPYIDLWRMSVVDSGSH